MARDPEPAVAAPAVARLLEIDPALLDAWLDNLLAGRDANVRRDANLRLLAVEALRHRPSEKHLRLLNARLDDEHSGVRVAARDSLAELAADKKWREQILQDATALLKTGGWRGQEQATLLVTQFDHKPAADRLVKLLTSQRAEVAIAAAWALRKLAVADTLPEIVKHIESRLKPLVSGRGPAGPTETLVFLINNHQLSQLNQLLGQLKYRPAEPLLRRFVPRPMVPAPSAEARAAAIYALGLIHEGRAPDDLVTAVEARLNDTMSLPPEEPRVRWMSAVALGRWKAKTTVPSLRKYYPNRKPSADFVNNACGWAIWQITGEVVPPADLVHTTAHDWFLIPQGGE
jgi:HEAT repeat protein